MALAKSKTKRSSLGRSAHARHVAFFRRMNDMVVFIGEAIPVLENARNKLRLSKDVKKYEVVSADDGVKISTRSPEELRKMFDSFVNCELREALLVSAVSHFESDLFATLREILEDNPYKLLPQNGSKGNVMKGDISIDLKPLLETSKEQVISDLIHKKLLSKSYASPRDYLDYFALISGVSTSTECFGRYIEVKATRDIIVHNGSISNDIYCNKAGQYARGDIGDRLEMDDKYFFSAIKAMKQCSLAITKGMHKNFPPTKWNSF